MHRIPVPDPRSLLLPILACLPTAFLSPRPPPALLPLLSPILRQRVHLLSATSGTSLPNRHQTAPNNTSTWLNLLTWSTSRAAHLSEAVENLHLEAHPVSGELELFGDGDEEDGEVGKVWYRRLDAETLQARCSVREHGIAVVWVWCRNDSGGTGLEALQGGDPGAPEPRDAWKVAEVLAVLDADEDREQWYESMWEADEASGRYSMRDEDEGQTLRNAHPENGQHPPPDPVPTFTLTTTAANARTDVDDDDDDYWASYDRTPIRTPLATKPTPTPGQTSSSHHRTTSEQAYFARYGAEVQPALDAHDPDEEADSSAFESTLRGGVAEASQSNGARQKTTMKPTKPASPRPNTPASPTCNIRNTTVSPMHKRIRKHASTRPPLRALRLLARATTTWTSNGWKRPRARRRRRSCG